MHRSLWPALIANAEAKRWKPLSNLAEKLLRHVLETDNVRLDALTTSGFTPSKELTKAGAELESVLVVHASGVRADSVERLSAGVSRRSNLTLL